VPDTSTRPLLVGQRLAAAAPPNRPVAALQEEEEVPPANTSSAPSISAKTSAGAAPLPPSADDGLARLTSVIQQMQQQLTDTNERLEKRVREIENAKDKEVNDYYHYPLEVRALQDENDELRARAEKRQATAPTSVTALLEDPEYQIRFELLIRQGQYSMSEVHAALNETKQEGKYSSQRADAHLKAKSQNAEVQALAQANRSLGEQPILPEWSLGRLLKV
jgi:hypothetical protein